MGDKLPKFKCVNCGKTINLFEVCTIPGELSMDTMGHEGMPVISGEAKYCNDCFRKRTGVKESED